MKLIAASLLLIIAVLAGCSKADEAALLSRYVPEVYGKVTILESSGRDWGMDFDLIWKARADDLDTLLSGLTEYNPKTHESGLISKGYPDWWPAESARKKMPAYFWNKKDVYKVIWHDTANRVIYIQWFNT
jgi:hypothetical protein